MARKKKAQSDAPVEAPPKEQVPAEVPECPKGSAQFGDKDPAVIAWYKKYEPGVYKKRYAEYVEKHKIKLP